MGVPDGMTRIYDAADEPRAAFADWIEAAGVFGAVLPGAELRIRLLIKGRVVGARVDDFGQFGRV
ncbi:hypothetical protein N7517_011455 [Penicillium concentricum]|uniref:Uncharacterized protein n=1 Tax=Penicillium concentricum TaxID=293559 RepID=A0A9W9UW18_9EURO|nr:uncharacterized protein N7517_011455 [Penicillium concentricum]KAJ5356846.1 hypothetical protein N7517_011455 [Penicillium concentricum]